MLRRLIIVGAIALCGAAAGVAVGNFAAGGQGRQSGAEELANYSSAFKADEPAKADPTDDPGFAQRAGPSSYDCKGCDSHAYNDMMPAGDYAPAQTDPIPAYRVEDAPLPPRAGLAGRRDAPPLPADRAGSLIDPTASDRATAIAPAPARN